MSAHPGRVLWAKDRPWILFLALGGVIAWTATIGDGGFFRTLALNSGHHDSEFHAAWICGLTLGLVASCFDTVLGMRDFLRQRSVSVHQLFVHRVGAMLVVLGIWFIVAPLGAWLWMVAFEAGWSLSLGAVLAIWGACIGAFSAAAIGLFAGMLPTAWWMRLLVGGAAFLTVFSAIDRLALLETGYHSGALYVGLHLGAAVLFGALAWSVRSLTADADRPWSRGTRLGAGTVALAAVVAFAAGGLAESERTASWWLRYEYPVVVVHDGVARLADRESRWQRGGVKFLDAAHRPTGETAPRSATRDVSHGWRVIERNWLGFDCPRWHRGMSSARLRATLLYLTWDGRVWLRSVDSPRSPLRSTGKGAELSPFGEDARLYESHGEVDWVLVHERSTQTAYRFDPTLQYFVPITLPDGDRLTDVEWGDPTFDFVQGGEPEHRLVLRGGNGAYMPRGDTLVRVQLEEPGPQPDRDIPAIVRFGPIVATVEVPADGDRPAFTHEFRPRTFAEFSYAGIALCFAGVQPPLANLFGRALGITLLSFAFGLLSAWLAARYLRRIGAPGHVRKYWIAFCVLLGPVALLMCVVLERARAHRERARVPAVPPRIFTALTSVEAAR